MAVKIEVRNPERIRDLNEVDDVLSRIITYEEETNCPSGVLLIQNRQFGGLYRIKSKDEAKEYIDYPGKVEWGIKFYSHDYFEALREKLRAESAYKTQLEILD